MNLNRKFTDLFRGYSLLVILMCIGFLSQTSFSGDIVTQAPKPLAGKINSLKMAGKFFKGVELFKTNSVTANSSSLSAYLNKSVTFTLDEAKRNELFQLKPEQVTFKIPDGHGNYVELEMYKVKVTTDDFKTGELTGTGTARYINYEPGLYYRGIVKGNVSSFASVSIFPDFVMAVFSNSEGNWNLASVRDEKNLYTNNYVLYNDVDLKSKHDFKCSVDDDSRFDKRSISWSHQQTGLDYLPQQVVRKYFECDYKMYQDFGSSTANVNNYVTSFFNSVAAMYQNDSINTVIQQIFVWTTPDIYVSQTDNTDILKRFGARMQNSINGDLAHWVSTRTDISGGVAWVGVLCTPFEPQDSSGRYAVSVIDNMLLPFPQYSWVVNVVVHEMGHNLGSNHTHNCSWPGGPIDSCYQVEGGCYSGPLIPRVGTVMSYCHLNSSVNLALGFGHYPGDTVRANIRRAGCLPIGISQLGTEIPAGYMLKQNYPNPFNPSTNIKFLIPEKSFVELIIYDALGKQVNVLVNQDMDAGTYNVDWNALDFPSGIYFYKLTANDFTETKKMVLIK